MPLSVTERGWGEVLKGTASPSGRIEEPCPYRLIHYPYLSKHGIIR